MFNRSPKYAYVWQGAADRRPVMAVVMRVVSIKPRSRGWFGIGNSPSIKGYLPDPMTVRGERLPQGGSVAFDLPAGELPAELGSGSRAALLMVDDKHVIGVVAVPAAVSDATAAEWAMSQAPR